MTEFIILVSVSSRSYILSYYIFKTAVPSINFIWFPSPLGVIFSLMKKQDLINLAGNLKFPSPLGVIFSLIGLISKTNIIEFKVKFPSPLGVIFSLIRLKTFLFNSKIVLFPSPLGVIFSLMKGIY